MRGSMGWALGLVALAAGCAEPGLQRPSNSDVGSTGVVGTTTVPVALAEPSGVPSAAPSPSVVPPVVSGPSPAPGVDRATCRFYWRAGVDRSFSPKDKRFATLETVGARQAFGLGDRRIEVGYAAS